MNDNNTLTIEKKDFDNLSKIEKLVSEKRPEKIIFDLSLFKEIRSFHVAFISCLIKLNDAQQINAKMFFKNPNHHVLHILQQIKLLEFGEVID